MPLKSTRRKNQRGIDDDVLVLVDDVGSTEEEAKWQRKHRALCALNLAACKQKLDKFDEAIAACDTALELDPDNVKALYRRAESRIRPVKATAYEHDLAIKDLAKANRLDPSNQTVERLLVRLRGERRVQREKDAKTFTGMFDRGQIYDKVAHEARVAAATAKGGSLLSSGATYQDLEKRIEEISEEDPLEKRIQDAELLRDLYVRNGKEDEARKLNEQIKEAKKAVKAVEQPKIDWANPPAELVEDAKRHGLDLMDPVVVQELKRLELEGFDKLEEVAEGATDPEEEEDDLQVPWKRYLIFFLVMYLFWCLVDVALLSLAPKQMPKLQAEQQHAERGASSGHSLEVESHEIEEEAVPDEDMPSPTPGHLRMLLDYVSPWIFGEADETEL
ncbi:unnamed protein product [Durusdinium trenchii]|uniref:Uncharacterized protein n=1 Tax=Durusdinium trenchii TaxID=1381693 RepID=A0ABP0NT35_9DINO